MFKYSGLNSIIINFMSSINYNRGSVSNYEGVDLPECEDEADFFSITNAYNQRNMVFSSHRIISKMNTIYNYNFKNKPKTQTSASTPEQKSRKTRSYQHGR